MKRIGGSRMLNSLEIQEITKDLQMINRLDKYLKSIGKKFEDLTQTEMYEFIGQEYRGKVDRYGNPVSIGYDSETQRIIEAVGYYRKIKLIVELLECDVL